MKKSGLKRKLSALATRVRADLERWHSEHEFNVADMIEEQPELFRALLAHSPLFAGSEIGEKYCRLVNSAVRKAETSSYYKEAFVSPRADMKPKDKLSIGRLISANKREKQRREKH